MDPDLYRQLPKIDRLVADPRLQGLPRALVVEVARALLRRLREQIAQGRTELPDIPAEVSREVRAMRRGRIRPVLNATGIVVHTNLGRAPWAPEAQAAAVQAMGPCNVELDLQRNARGGRLDGIDRWMRHLVGAPATLVVNNGAAAVLLAVTALARDREVVVSRGELVEIGGSFRIPEVIASGGARLREVGTTNRTRAEDYRQALGEQTGALLRVHPSNFQIRGFTERADRRALVRLAQQAKVPLIEDLGSGLLRAVEALPGEETVAEAVAAGVDAVIFSGDKLLGGPQAGIVVGSPTVVARLRGHPLYRALRVDKVILAALERTLALYGEGRLPPVMAQLCLDADALSARAEGLAEALRARGVRAKVGPGVGYAGGGALPMEPLTGPVVLVDCEQLDAVARRLRTGEPAVLARIADDRLILDPRTLPVEAREEVAQAVAWALVGGGVAAGEP